MPTIIALNALLKAPSKAIVEKCLNLCFVTRNEDRTLCITSLQEILELETQQEVIELHEAIIICINTILVKNSLDDLADLFQIDGTEVNGKLKQLIGQTISMNAESWREASAMDRVSLPKLIDFDWAIHLKKASNEVASMNVPTVVISLEVENGVNNVGKLPTSNNIDFELNREALETMLDGLGRIRDQLSLMG